MIRGHVGERADLQQHAQNFLVRAAVQRAVQRRGRRGRRRKRVHMRAAHAAHRVRRTILLVVRVQNKQDVQRVLQRRVRAVLQLGRLEQHVQEIAGIAQLVVRIGERHAQAVPVGKRRERRHLPDQAVGLLLARLLVEDVLGLGIKRGKRRDGRNHHAHRMGVVVKPVQEFLHRLVDEGVVRDVVGPIFQLRAGGQLAMQNQISRFEVGAFLGQFLDRIAAVSQDAFVAVDERDLALTQGRIVEGRVVAHHPELIGFHFDLAQIGGVDRVVLDRNFVGFSRAVIGNG